MYGAFPTQCHRGSLFQIGLVVSGSYCQHLFKYTSFRVIQVFEIMKDLQLLYYPPRRNTYPWVGYTPTHRSVLAKYEEKIIDSYSTICEYFFPRLIPLINRECLIKCNFYTLVSCGLSDWMWKHLEIISPYLTRNTQPQITYFIPLWLQVNNLKQKPHTVSSHICHEDFRLCLHFTCLHSRMGYRSFYCQSKYLLRISWSLTQISSIQTIMIPLAFSSPTKSLLPQDCK